MLPHRGGGRRLAVVALAAVASEPVAASATAAVAETYEARWAVARALHRVIDGYLARSLCRLDGGALCKVGRDSRPFPEGRGAFAGSDGEWAVSGHSGESEEHTRFLFDAAFRRAPRRVCEVGFNVGHSAVTLLTAAGANSSYLGFDLPRLNVGVNEEFFELLRLWLGGERLEIRWGDAGLTIPRYLAEASAAALTRPSPPPAPAAAMVRGGAARGASCDLLFYDGAHDALSVLRGLSLLRKLAAVGPDTLVILDDVRCSGPLCGHSALAWDFMVWAGQIREERCQSARSVHARARAAGDAGEDDSDFDFGACLGRFRWGPAAAGCAVFDARCVLNSYEDYRAESGAAGPPAGAAEAARGARWSKCCLSRQPSPELGPASVVVGL